MANRSTVDFSEKIGPIFRQYADTYGVQNICSLGVLLVDTLTAKERELFIGMIAGDTPLETIKENLSRMYMNRALSLAKTVKGSPRRIYRKPKHRKKE
jgi:hypothetical protein